MDNLIGKKFVYGGDVVEVRVVDGETVAAVDSQNRVVVLKKKNLTQPVE